MRDGSGNPPVFLGDYSVPKPRDPDAARTEWRLGHAQKKIPDEISKGINVFYVLGEIIRFPPLLCLLSPQRLYNLDIKTYCKGNG
jgi:hypothetical protein